MDPAKLRFPHSRCMEASDARDWNVIRSWADELAETFAPAVPRVTSARAGGAARRRRPRAECDHP